MEIKVYDFSNPTQFESKEIPESIYETDYREGLIHQVVTTLRNSMRQGSKAQKSRADVSGGGAKPWKQKGSGRARAGSNRSPIWRKGGVTFAARPRDYSKKINKKEYRLALKSTLAELVRQDRVKVFKALDLPTHKTKDFVTALAQHQLQDCLFVVNDIHDNLFLAARNVRHIGIIMASDANPYNLIAYKNVLFTDDAFSALNEALS